jgi:hypothetical protein
MALAGCGPGFETMTLSITDHPDALTSSGGDNLFTLTVVQSSKSYPIGEVMVTAGLAGQTATVVNFTHNDLNGDGKLDPGESLSCTEPPVNLFASDTVGKAVNVSLDTKSGANTLVSVAEGTWTPTN